MSTSIDFINYICEQINGVGEIIYKNVWRIFNICK